MSRSKFLWNSGCGSISQFTVTSPLTPCLPVSISSPFSSLLSPLLIPNSTVLNAFTSSSKSSPTISLVYCRFFIATMVFFGRNLKNDVVTSLPSFISGTSSALSRFSFDSCESTSKVRIESTSSPKKSMRNGYSLLYENTSTILPLTANCPGS